MTSYNHREYVVFRTEYCHWNLYISSAMTPTSSHVLLLHGPANATHANWASLAHFSIAKLNGFNRAAVLLVRTIRHYTLSNSCHYH
jgi:hypothetical protein